MKNNHSILLLFVTVIMAGLMTGVFILVGEREAVPGGLAQNQTQIAESHGTAPISKGTILLLLAVGVIGALGVSRTKKNNGNDVKRDAGDRVLQPPHSDKDRRKLIGRSF